MGSVHNDLHSWANKARAKGFDTIEISVDTALKASGQIVDLSSKLADDRRQLRVHCLWLLDIISNHGLKDQLSDEEADVVEHIDRCVGGW